MVSPNASLAAIEDKLLYPDDHLIWCSKLDSGPRKTVRSQTPQGFGMNSFMRVTQIHILNAWQYASHRSPYSIYWHVWSKKQLLNILTNRQDVHKEFRTLTMQMCCWIVDLTYLTLWLICAVNYIVNCY